MTGSMENRLASSSRAYFERGVGFATPPQTFGIYR